MLAEHLDVVEAATKARDDRAPVEDDLQFGDGGHGVEHLDVRGGEDPPLVGVAPVVVEPAVERLEHGHRRLRVVAESVLETDAERGEQQRCHDPLLVHHLQADVTVPVLGPDRLQLTEGLDDVLLLRVAAVPVEEGSRLGDGIEGRVGDVGAHLPADQQAPAPVDLDPADAPVPQALVLVAGEGILGFVVVVVEVEDPGGVRRHRRPPRG